MGCNQTKSDGIKPTSTIITLQPSFSFFFYIFFLFLVFSPQMFDEMPTDGESNSSVRNNSNAKQHSNNNSNNNKTRRLVNNRAACRIRKGRVQHRRQSHRPRRISANAMIRHFDYFSFIDQMYFLYLLYL
jgi:hypothetical protein